MRSASCRRRCLETPGDVLAAAIRHERTVAEFISGWWHPGLLDQRDDIVVARQSIEVGAEMAGETLKQIEPASLFEGLEDAR